jgi:orotate phosphoribosyltransferase-like protein
MGLSIRSVTLGIHHHQSGRSDMSAKKFFEIDDVFNHNGKDLVCVDTFRATGTSFARCINVKDYQEHKSRRYVECTYLTVPDWISLSKTGNIYKL